MILREHYRLLLKVGVEMVMVYSLSLASEKVRLKRKERRGSENVSNY